LSLLERQLALVNRLAAANELPDPSITTASGLKVTPLDAVPCLLVSTQRPSVSRLKTASALPAATCAVSKPLRPLKVSLPEVPARTSLPGVPLIVLMMLPRSLKE
jgi:hypothetical protein